MEKPYNVVREKRDTVCELTENSVNATRISVQNQTTYATHTENVSL